MSETAITQTEYHFTADQMEEAWRVTKAWPNSEESRIQVLAAIFNLDVTDDAIEVEEWRLRIKRYASAQEFIDVLRATMAEVTLAPDLTESK